MKNRRGEYLYFCSAEQDSLYALTLFREKEKQGTLNVQETGLLLCMEQRAEDSWIYLMPAAVYAAANGTASEKRTGRARPALRGIYEAAAVHTGEPANKWYRCEAICKGIGS